MSEPITEETISDADVEILNQARTILTAISNRAGARAWDAPGGNAAALGRIDATAYIAGDAIFTVLNWANSFNVRSLTPEQLHNRSTEEANRD